MTRSTLTWKVFDDVLVSFATPGEFSDQDWAGLTKALRETRATKYISATIGATEVTSLQRKAATDAIKSRQMPVIVITDEGLVRGLVTAASWLGVNIRALSWNDLREIGPIFELSSATANKITDSLKDFRSNTKR